MCSTVYLWVGVLNWNGERVSSCFLASAEEAYRSFNLISRQKQILAWDWHRAMKYSKFYTDRVFVVLISQIAHRFWAYIRLERKFGEFAAGQWFGCSRPLCFFRIGAAATVGRSNLLFFLLHFHWKSRCLPSGDHSQTGSSTCILLVLKST